MSPHQPRPGTRPDPPVPGPAAYPVRTSWLVAVLAAGLALRVDHLDERSYWFDEGFSWKMLTFPWREMVARVARDNHGPLYFLLAKVWAGLCGDSSLSLRWLSVLMGEATIFGMFLLAREAYRTDQRGGLTREEAERRGGWIGLLTAALVALSPFQIHWATEVRMYTLGTALAAFSGWLLLRALWRPGVRIGSWAAYSVTAALFAYTHPYALFSIAAQAAFAFGYVAACNGWRLAALGRDRRTLALLLSYLAVFALWSPWLPVLIGQRRQVGESFWLPPMSWWQVGKVAYQMFAPLQGSIPPGWAAGLAAATCAAAFAALVWRAGPADGFIFLTALLPVALSAGLSFAQFNIFHRYYLLFAHLSFLAAIAALVARVRAGPGRRAAAAAVLVGFLGVDAVYLHHHTTRAKIPGARAASALLDERRAPGEPVVVCSLMLTPCLEGHARLGQGWHTYLPPEGYRHYEGTAVARPDEFLTEADVRRLSAERVWVVDVERWEKPAHAVPIPPDWAKEGEWRFPEIYGDRCEIIVRAFRPRPRDAQPQTSQTSDPTPRTGPGRLRPVADLWTAAAAPAQLVRRHRRFPFADHRLRLAEGYNPGT